MLAQRNGHCIEQKVFLPATIKSHVVKSVITWSISLDENNNIGLVYRMSMVTILVVKPCQLANGRTNDAGVKITGEPSAQVP